MVIRQAPAQVQDMFVTANDLTFHYRAWGNVNAPPLLILHGMTSHAWEWDPFAAALADRFHVIVPDQRGHGATSWATEYAPRSLVDDVAALVTVLQPGRVSIVGHSMGGIVGYLFAHRHPTLVERLAIGDVGPDSLTSGWAAANLLPLLRTCEEAVYETPDEALAAWLADSPHAHHQPLRQYVTHNLIQRSDGRWVWRFDAGRMHTFVDSARDETAQWAAIREIACPTLVVRGATSEVLSASTATRMARDLPNGRLVEIPECGHDLPVEQPAATLDALRDFLNAR